MVMARRSHFRRNSSSPLIVYHIVTFKFKGEMKLSNSFENTASHYAVELGDFGGGVIMTWRVSNF